MYDLDGLQDLISIVIFGLLALAISKRRRAGKVGEIVERIKRQVQDAVATVQSDALAANTTSRQRSTPVLQPRSKKTEEANYTDWQGLEGTERQAVPESVCPSAEISSINNPLPVVSDTPVVQAMAMAEVLGRPKGARRWRE